MAAMLFAPTAANAGINGNEPIVIDFTKVTPTVTDLTNLNGSAANGQAFYIWEKADKTDSKRQDFKGYTDYTGTEMEAVCHVWRRSDRLSGNLVDGGLKCPNDREMVISGLTDGSIVQIYYLNDDVKADNDSLKSIVWAAACNADGSQNIDHTTMAQVETKDGAETAVSGQTLIPSGADIKILYTNCGYFGFKVKKGMIIAKVKIIKAVNERTMNPMAKNDFAAEAKPVIKQPANFNGNQNNGQGFFGWEKADKSDSKRNDYKGYTWEEGLPLPEECHIWRRSDRINNNIIEGGLKCPNDREMAIDGLEAGSKVKIFYTTPGVEEFLSLKDIPFGTWSDWVNGELTTPSDPQWKVGESSDMPYGDGSVIRYADLSAYVKLEVTVSEGTPRFLFNRDVNEGQWNENEAESHLIDNTKAGWSAKYFSSAAGANEGETVWTVDLAQMVADKGYAHLHAIKGANFANCTITDIKVVAKVPHIIYATGDGTSADGPGIVRAQAQVNGVDLVTGETEIASGAEINILSVTPAVKGTGYIVVKVRKNMVISKIEIVNGENTLTYDFAALTSFNDLTNLNGSTANGAVFYVWEKEEKADSKRQDFKGYTGYDGNNLEADCHIWRRSDRLSGNLTRENDVFGLKCPNDREMVINGLTAGSQVKIEYVSNEANDSILWATGATAGTIASVKYTGEGDAATEKLAVSGKTLIPSGAEINILNTNGGYFGFKVKKGMVITNIEITTAKNARTYDIATNNFDHQAQPGPQNQNALRAFTVWTNEKADSLRKDFRGYKGEVSLPAKCQVWRNTDRMTNNISEKGLYFPMQREIVIDGLSAGSIVTITYDNAEVADSVNNQIVWATAMKDGKALVSATVAGREAVAGTTTVASGAAIAVKEATEDYIAMIVPENVYIQKIEIGYDDALQVPLKWDFTQWSEATKANLLADAAASKTEGWSDVEKEADAKADADPTEISKDNCFWYQGTVAEDGNLTANGVVIEETKGLKFDAGYTAKRSLAIAVNYPTTSLGTYAGPAYLWLGGGGSKQKFPCFTIPAVAAGSMITIEMESHKPSDARGIGLYYDSYDEANLIGEQFKPTTKDTHTWTIEKDADVVIWNTSGCHIYTITVAPADANASRWLNATTGISTFAVAPAQNDAIYNLSGQRIIAPVKGQIYIKNGKKFMVK